MGQYEPWGEAMKQETHIVAEVTPIAVQRQSEGDDTGVQAVYEQISSARCSTESDRCAAPKLNVVDGRGVGRERCEEREQGDRSAQVLEIRSLCEETHSLGASSLRSHQIPKRGKRRRKR